MAASAEAEQAPPVTGPRAAFRLLRRRDFAQFAAILVLAPWTGAVADRFDRRKVILVTQLGAAALTAVLAALAFAGEAGVAVVIGFSLALGVGSAFSAPASQAFVSSLVAPSDLRSALALNSMTYNLARAIGPAAAAVTVAALGI